MKSHHQLPESECHKGQASPITKEEENALRYVSGYVCRKVQENIKSSSLQNKQDMLLFISEFSGDEWDETRGTEELTNAVDRGGLWHVNDDTYTMFYLMEEEIRSHLQVQSAKALDSNTRRTLLDATLNNEDLLFHWRMLSSTIDDDIGVKIAELCYNSWICFCIIMPRTL